MNQESQLFFIPVLVSAFIAPISAFRLVHRTEMDESAIAAIGFIQQCVIFFEFFFIDISIQTSKSFVFALPDPFFTLSVLFNSWIPGMLDALFQSTFLCSLLMFWLCIYHGLRQNERKFLTFYLPKLIVILPMWLCAIVLATWEKYNELRDPTYNHFVDTGNYQVGFLSL